MDRVDYIKNHYQFHCDEHQRLRRQSGLPEFYITMYYIHKYLKPLDRVLEIGAATGRYSHAIAREGYSVDAIELLDKHIQEFLKYTQDGENVYIRQGDALNLPVEDNTYDITLLLGPMYHLFTRDDQLRALSEAIRVTKPNGIIFAAYCGVDACVVQHSFGQNLITDPAYTHRMNFETFHPHVDPSEVFTLHHVSEINDLMFGFNTERLHLVGPDMFTAYIENIVNDMDDRTFQLWLDYTLSICERSDLLGVSNHLLDIFRKKV